MAQSLAVKYRPKTWEDVKGQSSTKMILQQQLGTDSWKQAVLFVGPAGCGKTTCARIFANEINKGQGNPIELDAASNNSVDDIRRIGQQAKTQSLDSEYKIFIIDECHALSNSAWQAMLKLIEEPPAKSIFILCTTESQKIPKTILSRCQRFDFQRITLAEIEDRLREICEAEGVTGIGTAEFDKSINYIAKLADGGARDSITLLDKCLAMTPELEFAKVVAAVGAADYNTFMTLLDVYLNGNDVKVVELIDHIYNAGTDIKQFVRLFTQFLLDVRRYEIGCDWKYMQLPALPEYVDWLSGLGDSEFTLCANLLDRMVRLNSDIKYSMTPRYDLETVLILEMRENK